MAAPPTVPPLADWLTTAREDNPGVPEAALTAYYEQTYAPTPTGPLPIWDDWIQTAKQDNPEVPEDALRTYWQETYGARGAKEHDPGDVGRGFKHAFQQIPQLAYGAEAGLGAAGEAVFGEGGLSTGIKQHGLKHYREKTAELAQDAKPTDSITYSWEQAKAGNLGALADWLQYMLGYTSGQVVQTLATAGLGSVVGKATLGTVAKTAADRLVQKEAARLAATEEGAALAAEELTALATANVAGKLGQTTAIGAQALGMEGGEIFGGLTDRADQDGRTVSGEELAKAMAATLGAGVLEFAGDKFGLDLILGKSRVGKVAGTLPGTPGRVVRGAIQGTAGAIAEGTTELAQTLVEKIGQGEDPFSDASIREAIDAAALGAGGGAVVGGTAGVLSAGKPTPVTPAAVPPVAAPAPPPFEAPSVGVPPLQPGEPAGTSVNIPRPEPSPIPPIAEPLINDIPDVAGVGDPTVTLDQTIARLFNLVDAPTESAKTAAGKEAARLAIQGGVRLPTAEEAAEFGLAQPRPATGESPILPGADPQVEPLIQTVEPTRLKQDFPADPREAIRQERARLLQMKAGTVANTPDQAPSQAEAQAAPTLAPSVLQAKAQAGGVTVPLSNVSGRATSPLDTAAHTAAPSPKNELPEPTEAQIEAGNYQKGHLRIAGLEISVEHPEGSTRTGTTAQGQTWERRMAAHYGYIRRTAGADGEQIDVYVKPGTPSDYTGPVYVIDQKKANGDFDEHKAVLGATSQDEAIELYRQHYPADWDGIRSIKAFTLPQFKLWTKLGNHTQPVGTPTLTPSVQSPSGEVASPAPSQGTEITDFSSETVSEPDTTTNQENNSTETAPYSSPADVPRSELPDAQNAEIMLRAEKAQADLEIAGDERGTRVFTEVAGQGSTPEVRGLKSPTADWYKEATSGPQKLSKQRVERAIAKIIKDQGEDVGKDVLRVKELILADPEFTRSPWNPKTDEDWAAAIEQAKAQPEPTPVQKEQDKLAAMKRPKDGQQEIAVPPPTIGQKPNIKAEAPLDETPLFSQEAQTPEDEQTALPETDDTRAAEQVASFVHVRLTAGLDFTKADLFAQAERAFAKTRAQGLDAKQVFDAMELGVNRFINRQKYATTPKSSVEVGKVRLDQLRRQVMAHLPSQMGVRSEEMQEFQQFSTPPDLAFAMAWAAQITAKDTVLEPSAGLGGLLVFAKNVGATTIANEYSARRHALLETMHFDRLFGENAEQLDNVLPDDVQPTVVLMNPPFSTTAGRMEGTKRSTNILLHIGQALERLAPGGRAVVLIGEPKPEMNRRPSEALLRGLDTFAKQYTLQASIAVSGKGYAKYGTTYDNRILIYDKVAPSPDHRAVTGRVEDVTDALPLLKEVRDARQAADVTDRVESTPAQSNRAALAEGRPGASRPDETVSPATPVVGRGGERPEVSRQPQPGVRPEGAAPAGKPVPAGQSGSGARGGVRAGGREPAVAESGTGGDAGGRGLAGAGRPGEPTGQRPDAGPQPTERLTLDAPPPAETETAALTDSIFETYTPKKARITGAKAHPGKLVESAAMSAVDPPQATYQPRLPKAVITKGKVSDAQLEVVIYAGQAHETLLPNGQRKGFFVGDGTGVGKGREIAATILDNFEHGRTKAVWITKNAKLMRSAVRDWTDIGGSKEDLFDAGKLKLDAEITKSRGIAFGTYGLLRTGSMLAPSGKLEKSTKVNKQGQTARQSRIQQLVQWLGPDFDGAIVFDEAHLMRKNDEGKGSRGKTKPSIQALAGLELQKLLPKARILYASATGGIEVSDFGYAERLGMWGEGTPFANKQAFNGAIESGGLAAMEVVSQDLKANGLYVSRSLSYDDVTYERLQHDLTDAQRGLFDTMAKAWQKVLQNLHAALEATGVEAPAGSGGKTNGQAKSAAMSKFWGAHQRFFNQILTALQMPSVLKRVKADIEKGEAVVIQLVNTNEATQDRQIDKIQQDEGSLEELDLTPRENLMQYIERSFPTQQFEDYTDDNGNVRSRPVQDAKGNPVQNKLALKMKRELLEALGSLKVPDGPLEYLLNTFGEGQVAEVTGRGQRVVRTPDGETVIQKRSEAIAAKDAEAFMNDQKPILVFSDAGGTGESYHADKTKKNQRKRNHYVIQPGWRADSAMQGLGRTHRTNQKQAPHYMLVSTDLNGHRRFISTIARRLSQLGALTKGQRNTSSQGLFSEKDNLENAYARGAVYSFLKDLQRGQVPEMSWADLTKKLGFDHLLDEAGALNDEKIPTVPQFLNRLLSLEYTEQNAVFDQFYDRMSKAVENAVARGEYETGLENYKADSVKVRHAQTVYTDKDSGATVRLIDFEVHNKVQFRSPTAMQEDKAFLSFVTNNQTGKVFAAFRAQSTKTDEAGNVVAQVRLAGPQHGTGLYVDLEAFAKRYTRIDEGAGTDQWQAAITAAPQRTDETVHLIEGALLKIWDRLPSGTSRVYRIQTDDGKRFVGRAVAEDDLASTLEKLGVSAAQKTYTAEDVAERIVEQGATAELANGWKLKRARVGGEERIELTGRADFSSYRPEFKGQGLFAEVLDYKTRWFVPIDHAAEIIGKLTEHRPVVKVTGKKAAHTEDLSNAQVAGSDEPPDDAFAPWAAQLRAQRLRPARTFAQARVGAREFLGRDLMSADGLIATVSRNALDKMLSDSAVRKSSSLTEHTLAVANLDRLFAEARIGETHPDRNADAHLVAIHRLYAPMLVGTQARLVKLTVKAYTSANQGTRLYSVEAIDVERMGAVPENMAEADSRQRPTGPTAPISPASSAVLSGRPLTEQGTEATLSPTSARPAGLLESLAQRIRRFNRGGGEDRVRPQEARDAIFRDPPTAEAEAVQAGIEGKSALAAARFVADAAPSEATRLIARRVTEQLRKLEQAGQSFVLHVAHLDDMVPTALLGARGLTWKKGGSHTTDIWINGADVTGKVGTSYETVLHELVHAVTQTAVHVGNKKVATGTPLGAAVSDLYDVSNAIIGHFNQRVRETKGQIETLTPFEQTLYRVQGNALQNPDEILTWALTNREMQRYLDTIPYKGRSLWEWFVVAVRRFLGLEARADTALSEVLRISDALLDTNVHDLLSMAEGHAPPMTVNVHDGLMNQQRGGSRVIQQPQLVKVDTLNRRTQDDIAAHLLDIIPQLDGRIISDVRDEVFGLVNEPRVMVGYADPKTLKKQFAKSRAVSPLVVKQYREMLREGVEFDPVLMNGDTFEDGGHRVEAYLQEGRKRIPVVDIGPLINMDWDRWLSGDQDYFPFEGGDLMNRQQATTFDDGVTFEDLNRPDFTGLSVTQQHDALAYQLPPLSRMDDVTRTLQDKNIDLVRLVDAIRTAGATVADDVNPVLKEELYMGRTAQRLQDFLNTELRPLIDAMRLNKVTMPQLEEYLHARHAKEANAYLKEINPDRADNDALSGLSDEEAARILAAADRPKMDRLAARVDTILANTRQLMVSYGLESPERVQSWMDRYSFYVPLHRTGFEDGPMGTGQGRSIRGSSVKNRTGSTRGVVHILANVALDREKAIVRGEKMRPVVALAGLLTQHPNPEIATLAKPTPLTYPDPETGLTEAAPGDVGEYRVPMVKSLGKDGTVHWRPDPNYKGRDNVVNFRIEGKDYAIVFNEQNARAMHIAKSLKDLDVGQLNTVMSGAARVTRFLAAVNTQYNPAFGVVNLVRDVQFVMLSLSNTPLAGQRRKVFATTWKALRGIYADARAVRRGERPSSATAKLWERFQQVGGPTGYRDLFRSSTDRAEAIRHMLDPDWWQKTLGGKILTAGGVLSGPEKLLLDKAGKPLFDWLSDYNTAMENAVRLGVFKAGLDQGLSDLQAASLAKNASVNFNKKGQISAQMGALYAFFNASVQGTARIAETLFEPGKFGTLSAVGKKIIAGGVTLGALQTFLLAMAGFDEDDPPDWLRARSLIIPVPGTDKGYVSLPMPLGFNVIPNVGRLAAETVLYGKPVERAGRMLAALVDAFSPVGGAATAAQLLAPTVTDPLVALSENTDWAGRRIYKEDFNSLHPTPGFTRTKDTATPWARGLAEVINYATGGSDYTPGLLSPTPDSIDYLVAQMTGGVGREGSRLAQTVSAVTSGEDLPLYKVPVAGRFIGSASGQSNTRDEFYRHLRELNVLDAEVKGRRQQGEDAAGFVADHPEARLARFAAHVEREVSNLNRRKRELVKRGAGREQIRLMDQQIAARMERLNRRVREMAR